MPPYEVLIQRLDTIKQSILKTIDFTKPYDVAMSCVEYLDIFDQTDRNDNGENRFF